MGAAERTRAQAAENELRDGLLQYPGSTLLQDLLLDDNLGTIHAPPTGYAAIFKGLVPSRDLEPATYLDGTNAVSATGSADTLFNGYKDLVLLRNAEELEQFYYAMVSFNSLVQLPQDDFFDWFSEKEDFLGYWYFHAPSAKWRFSESLRSPVTMQLSADPRVPPSVQEIDIFKERGYMYGGIHDAALPFFLACGAGFPACPRPTLDCGLLSTEGWGG